MAGAARRLSPSAQTQWAVARTLYPREVGRRGEQVCGTRGTPGEATCSWQCCNALERRIVCQLVRIRDNGVPTREGASAIHALQWDGGRSTVLCIEGA